MQQRLKFWHALLLVAVLTPISVWSADTMWSALSTLTGANSAAGDRFVLLDVSDTTHGAGGTAKTITRNELKVALGVPARFLLGSDYTNNSTTGTEITGIGPMTVASGTHHLQCHLIVQSAATTTGPQFGINYTGTVTEMANTLEYPDNGTTATTGNADGTVTGAGGELIVAHGSSLTETTTAPNLNVIAGAVAANENFWVRINSLMTVSDAGDIELWSASEVASSQITVQSGSYCQVTTL